MKKIVLLILSVISLCGCDDKTLQDRVIKLEGENDSLKNEIAALNVEIENYKNSPEKLMASAETFYKNRDDVSLNEIRNSLIKYHPECKELEKVTAYIDEIEKQKKKEADEAKMKAEKEAKKLEEQRMAAVGKLKKKYDDVSGITWYKPKTFVHYNDANLTSLYIGKKEYGTPWLRLKMSYKGDDWIFFESAYLSYDGNTRQVFFDRYDEKESDNSGGEVWEWIDVSVDDDLLSFLKEMVNGKQLKMRLSGKYTKTRNLSTKEINEIKDALLAYDVLLRGE